MPISGYFKGKGSDVMSEMQDRYGDKKGKSVFYATANKTGMKPGASANTSRIQSGPRAGEMPPKSAGFAGIKRNH